MTLTSPRRAGVALLLVTALLVTPVPGLAEEPADPPDQVDPPAPGEGEPLDDPSDPPFSESEGYTAQRYSASGHPSAWVSLSGPRWPDARWRALTRPNRYRGAAATARRGWPRGAGSVVLASRWPDAVSGSALAGAVRGPLLLTPSERLHKSARFTIRRLEARRVFLVGPLSARVGRQVRRLGVRTERIGGRDRYHVAAAAAQRAAEIRGARGRRPTRVIVASGQKNATTRGVAALAAGRRLPVLLTPRRGHATRLTRWVNELRPRKVLIIGGTSTISARVVRRLPGRIRITGGNRYRLATAVARAGRARGLTGGPVVVPAGPWAPSTYGGVLAGVKRDAPVLLTMRRSLPTATARWLGDHTPRRLLGVGGKGSFRPLVACQVREGGMRRWACAERELRRQGYDIRRADGRVDRFSVWAIMAFEKVAWRSRSAGNGSFTNAEWRRMVARPRYKVRRTDLPGDHVEINIARQLIVLVRNGKARYFAHTSTGKPSTPTVRGTFSVYEKRPYYQPWNDMYKAIFFYGGYAMHGYPSVPTYPASHGCTRTYNGNQDWLYPKISMGERVAVY